MPIKTPDFELTIGTLDFSQEELKTRVNEIVVEQQSDGASSFKIVLDDRDDQFADGKWKICEGNECTVKLGYFQKGSTGDAPAPGQLITGKVTGVKPQRKEYQRKMFVVTGFDGLQALTRGRKRRAWDNVTDAQLATEVAHECGLQPDVEDVGIVHPYVVQNNENDLAFLYERARRIGFEVKVEEKRLVFKKRKEVDSGVVLRWNGLNVEKKGGTLMQQMNFNTSTMNVVSKVVVRSYDPKTAKEIVAKAEKPSSDKMAGHTTAGEIADSQGINTAIQISDQPVRSAEEAEKLAQSILDQRAGEYLTGQGKCEGNPKIICGVKVKIEDVGKDLEGEYYITGTKHSFRVGHSHGFGYWTEFSVSRTGR